MKKRLLFICTCLFVVLIFCTAAQAAPKVMVDYRTVTFDVDPVIENGTTLVPLRAIFEMMGANVTWDANTATATAKKDDTTVILPIGSLTATINEQPCQLAVPAKIIDNRTLAPLRFVGEAFGAEVIWNNENQSIEITTLKSDDIPDAAKKPETWEKVIGTEGKYDATCIRQTRDGNYIITGSKDKDIYLVELDLTGEIQWEKTYGGDQADYGACVQETLDGGYIITGQTCSNGAGYGDVFLIKTDANGNKQWEKTFGRSGDDFGSYVQQTADGGYMIVGTLEPGGAGTLFRELWLIKTDNDGNCEWDKSFGDNRLFRGWSGLQTNDGGYILAGDTSDDYMWGIYVVKVDDKGNKEWNAFYTGPDMDSVSEIKQTNDGGYALVGYNTDGSHVSGFDLNMIKIDETGKLKWQRSYEGSRTDDYTMGQSLVQLADDSYILVGEEESMASSSLSDQAVLFKVNKNGDLQWSRAFSNEFDQGFKCVQLTYDGGLIIAGNRSPHGDYKTGSIYIVKTDIDGKINTNTK